MRTTEPAPSGRVGERFAGGRAGLRGARPVFILLAAAAGLAGPFLARADVGPPAHMRIQEVEPLRFHVTWRVPNVLPPRAVPEPVLPDGCEPVGEPTVTSQLGAWLFERTWTCGAPITDRVVGIRYPFADMALTTVVRVDLLSGDRFARVITPGDAPWRLPEGTAPPDPLREWSRAALAGISHAAGSPVHWLFLLALAALGTATALGLVAGFTAGQLLGVLAEAGPLPPVAGVPAGIALALAGALAAREALRPVSERRGLLPVVATAGLLHGLAIASLVTGGLGGGEAGLAASMIAVLGIDALHLIGAGAILAVGARLLRSAPGVAGRRRVAWATGVVATAAAVGLALTGGPGPVAATTGSSTLDVGGAIAAAGPAGSQRLAPATDAPLQSFLAIEPFEVRHEVMVRLAPLAGRFGLDPAATLSSGDQPAVLTAVSEYVVGHTAVEADGARLDPLPRRADFMTVSATGALPRVNPEPEPVADATIGVVVVYATDGIPERAVLRWEPWPEGVAEIPATVIDPETNRSRTLGVGGAELAWENDLAEDPIPSVDAIEVEPARVPIPWLGLPFFLGALWLALAAFRRREDGRRRALALPAARVALVIGLIVGPVVSTAIALPGSSGRVPSERQARRILAGLLPNIYRALEYRDESDIYDRLAVSVTGETLTDVYLEQQRSLQIEERGGAQARVEAVEVLDVSEVEETGAGFRARAEWRVGGMVTHFGHRHFRQNRYDAVIEVVPVDGTWKIDEFEVLELERIR